MEAIHGDVTIGHLSAYMARPTGEGLFPIAVVVHEIFGVHPHIQDICRRLADEGYVAIAPDLYTRFGDVSQMTDSKEIMERVVSKVPDDDVMTDLDAVASWAAADGHGDPDRLGITGFCWGGRVAWLYAAHSTLLKAAVAWYGRVAPQRTSLQPHTPVDVVSELRAPVLGLYGAKDAGIPVETLEPMRAARGSEIVVYADAGHGFFADYRPSYHAASAQDGWRRMLQWFAKHGV